MNRPQGITVGLAVVAAAVLAYPHPTLAQVAFGVGNVLRVQVTTSATTNCANLRQVLDGISGNGSTNRYLVELPPGHYECGTQPLFVKQWVALAGSGHLTSITGNPGTALGVVNLDHQSELRSLTVSALGAESTTVAISVFALAHAIQARLFEVDAVASTTGGGVAYGLQVGAPSGTNVEIDHSELHGEPHAISVGASSEIRVRFSILTCAGSPTCSGVVGSGGRKCLGSYLIFSPLNLNCD